MKSWAIIVGINQYPRQSGQSVLKGAVADAADFADWALHPDGGNVARERLFFWTHPAPDNPSPALRNYLDAPSRWWDPDDAATPDFSRAPTVDAITETAMGAAETALDGFTEGAGEKRRCYVFLAGHGVQSNAVGARDEAQTCFIAGDFRPARITMGLLPCEDLRRGLLTNGFDQVVMFLDCCRTRIPELSASVRGLGLPMRNQPAESAWAIGHAAQQNKIAWETPQENPTRGAFTQLLVEGLRRQRDSSRRLTIDSLRDYVRTRIPTLVQPNVQQPHFRSEPTDEPFELLDTPPIPTASPTADIRVSFTPAIPAGTILRLMQHDGSLLDTITVQPDGVRVVAPVGLLYSLETDDKQIVHPFLHGGPGETHVEL